MMKSVGGRRTYSGQGKVSIGGCAVLSGLCSHAPKTLTVMSGWRCWRVIPPLRLGNVSVDLASLVLLILVIVLMNVVVRRLI